MNGNITKDGITRDLEAMKAMVLRGINCLKQEVAFLLVR